MTLVFCRRRTTTSQFLLVIATLSPLRRKAISFKHESLNGSVCVEATMSATPRISLEFYMKAQAKGVCKASAYHNSTCSATFHCSWTYSDLFLFYFVEQIKRNEWA